MFESALGVVATSALPDRLFTRRVLFAVLLGATIIALLWLMAATLSAGGFDTVDLVILALFALILPWSVIGFWNATIGFLIMRFSRNPVAAVMPVAARVRGNEPITASTAILVCIRNETPERVTRNVEALLAGLAESGFADCFHVYLLSDTSNHKIAAAEEAGFGTLIAEWRERIAMTYRRRASNDGFKAGNIRDFCERWGSRHDFAVTLDADSIMTAQAILYLVRLMQAEPRLGILQGLVIGLPSASAFARLFQFGMRLGMRSYTIGSAWWQGDCGPYWGHNAVLRLKPFIAHCRLSALPEGGGCILSHDQIEAVLMRRAGYEVRVVPQEDLGWEENPPTLIEFIGRDLRWCQGNMQYWRLIALPNLQFVSRCQLALAMLMFVGSPAWITLFALAAVALARVETPTAAIDMQAGMMLLVFVFVMSFAPKIATALDVLMRPEARRAFGGAPRFIASIVAETLFSLLLTPIMWFSHTIFLVDLAFGHPIGWKEQVRDHYAIPVSLALRRFWPQTLSGLGFIGVFAAGHAVAVPYALFFAAGLMLSVPFAVATSSPAVGRLLMRIGLARLPEETGPAVRAVALAPSPCPA